jgi:hypothetical protein
MRKARKRIGRCGVCRRSITVGKVCKGCEARIARDLARARELVNRGLIAVGYHGTVKGLRERALPEIRRAAMQGLVLSAAVRVQARLNAVMLREGVDAA